VESGIRDTLVLRASVDVEVAFIVVDPPQRVVGAVESQKFDYSAFPSYERSLEGMRWPQELVYGVEAPQHLGEHDPYLLPPPVPMPVPEFMAEAEPEPADTKLSQAGGMGYGG
jgi:hypothetical protein